MALLCIHDQICQRCSEHQLESEIQLRTSPTGGVRSIAELTGKQHGHVMRDIENTLNQMGIGALTFQGTYRDKANRLQPCYHLDRFHTEVLVTGYDVMCQFF